MVKTTLMLTGALALSVAPGLVKADIIHHLINPATIKAFCKSNNGTYWPVNTSQGGHTYGCLYDGGVIVCGGLAPDQKNTCYESMLVPHRWPAPTPPHGHDKD